MQNKGLCQTCVESKACCLPKKLPVWECEEFSNGNNTPLRFKPVKIKRVASAEVVSESE